MDFSLIGFYLTVLLINTGLVRGIENLATDKLVVQKTNYTKDGTPRPAGRAIDGMPAACGSNVLGVEDYASLTADDPWWMIDLGQVYYITNITICYIDNGGLLYLQSTYNNDIDQVADSPTWLRHGYLPVTSNPIIVNKLQIFTARHLALLKRGDQTLSIREISIYGYTQADVDRVEIDIQHSASQTEVYLSVSVKYLDQEVFGNVWMQLKRVAPSTITILSEPVNSTYFERTITDSTNIYAGLDYTYHMDFTVDGKPEASAEILDLKKVITVRTPCNPPGAVDVNSVSFIDQSLEEIPSIAEHDGQRFVRGDLKFDAPNSGCIYSASLNYTLAPNPETPQFRYQLLSITNRGLRLSGMYPFTEYTLTLSVINVDGITATSAPVVIQTIEGEPYDGPEDVSLVALNQSCARLSWSKPPKTPNGNIIGYRITCMDKAPHNRNASLPVSEYFCGRPAGSKFTCNVSAFTNTYKTDGKLGKSVPLTTFLMQESPIASAVAVNSSCIKLDYERLPYIYGGTPKGYQINCSYGQTKDKTTQPVGSNSYIWCKFPPSTSISCTIAQWYGGDSVARGVDVSTTTLFSFGASKIETKDITESSDGVYHVPLPVIDLDPSQGEIKEHLVILYSAGSAARSKRSTSECPFVIDREKARPTTFDPHLPYSEAKNCDLDYYLAGKLDFRVEQGYQFPVGDGKIYGGVPNVPLEKGTSYAVYYGVYAARKGETTVVVRILEKAVATVTVPEAKNKQKGLTGGQLSGIVVTLVVLLAAIVVVVVLRLLRKRKKQEQPAPPVRFRNTGTNDYTQNATPIAPSRPKNSENGSKLITPKLKSTKGGYENCPTLPSPTVLESQPIPISQLEWYVESNLDLIAEQFEKLKDVQMGEGLAAKRPENKPKCRYKNIYAADEYRVLLHKQGSDFINASYIMGYTQEKRYIACQGPTDNMVDDFWLMAWQNNVGSIVMSTKITETNKSKCLQYWPDTQGEVKLFGEFQIENIGLETWPDYVITQLKVYRNGRQKWLTHYQFLSWPDHDVPLTCQPFITFYRKMARQTLQKPGPIIVHCSAGVGRTGAIIAFDYLLAQAKAEFQVDVFQFVQKMRMRRSFMVQTEDQYVFIHELLCDALSTEGFLTFRDMFPRKVADEALLAKEYQYIENTLRKVEVISESGTAVENRALNRSQSVIPDDKYRIYLNSADGQTYINAVRVDGYSKLDQFHATQLPLSHTVKDFWQMVHERSCKVIVQLGTTFDNVLFYSAKANQSISYGNGTHTITTKSVSRKGLIEIYQLGHVIYEKNVFNEPAQYTETSDICLIHLPRDQCETRPFILSAHMLSIAEEINKYCSEQGDVNVVVTSKDGGELCGLFICTFNCRESLRLTQEVEVYNQVLMARRRRRQFISTLSSYKHVYQTISKYAEQFENYQNPASV